MNTKKTLIFFVCATVIASLFFGSRGFPDSNPDTFVESVKSIETTLSGFHDAVRVTIRAASSSVAVQVPAGASVYDAMLFAASTTPFRFSARKYSGLGYFVESVGGIENANGFYWTLYVNGAYSAAGASSRTLEPSDLVEWRFEKQ
jgi:hypothetical protein